MDDELEKYKQLFKEIKESIKVAKSNTTDPEILKALDEIEEKTKKVKL